MKNELHTVSTRALLRLLGVDLPSKMGARLALARGGYVSREDFVEYAYGDREDGGPLYAHKIADAAVFLLRERRVQVVNTPTRGFQLAT